VGEKCIGTAKARRTDAADAQGRTGQQSQRGAEGLVDESLIFLKRP